MNLRSSLLPILLTTAAVAQTTPDAKPAKIAILQFQRAVLATQEGQQIAAELKAKFDPKRAALEKRQAELADLQKKIQAGAATLPAATRAKMQNDLNSGGRALNNDANDLNNELQQEEAKAMQSMAARMGDLIKNYATQKGFTVVLDVSAENTPVLWAAESANITQDIVKLYDQAHPATAAAAKPATPPAKKP